jgi:hypothetical protein
VSTLAKAQTSILWLCGTQSAQSKNLQCRAWFSIFDEEDVLLAAAAFVVIAEIVYLSTPNAF